MPQTAPSLLVGVCQLTSAPVPDSRYPDDHADVLPTVAVQPAERRVDPAAVDGQPRPLLEDRRVPSGTGISRCTLTAPLLTASPNITWWYPVVSATAYTSPLLSS